MRMIFLGPPGAGKGTLAVRMAEKFKLAHIATGDLLRKHVRKGTALGNKAKTLLDQGALVPDDLVIAMVEARIGEPDVKNGFILDGFPRTTAQGKALTNVLSQTKKPLKLAVYFKTSEDTIISRLSGRWTCPQCGMSFHTTNIPPKKKGICDRCGAALIQREDDKPDTVRRRLEVYEKETAPLIGYYQDAGLMREVSGDTPLEQQSAVLEELIRGIKS